MAKLDCLQEELAAQIKNFERESSRHRRLYRITRYLVFILASASTVLGSLALTYPLWQHELNLAIVLITSAVGVVTSIEGIRKPGELWIHERKTYYALKDLAREVAYASGNGLAETAVDKYFHRLQGILGASSEAWFQQVQPGRDKAPEPPRAAGG